MRFIVTQEIVAWPNRRLARAGDRVHGCGAGQRARLPGASCASASRLAAASAHRSGRQREHGTHRAGGERLQRARV